MAPWPTELSLACGFATDAERPCYNRRAVVLLGASGVATEVGAGAIGGATFSRRRCSHCKDEVLRLVAGDAAMAMCGAAMAMRSAAMVSRRCYCRSSEMLPW